MMNIELTGNEYGALMQILTQAGNPDRLIEYDLPCEEAIKLARKIGGLNNVVKEGKTVAETLHYNIEYRDVLLMNVKIVNDLYTKKRIQEMVEFWDGWEKRVVLNDGDYVAAFLIQLGEYVVRNNELPDDEGWYPFDGSRGIEVIDWTPFDPEDDEFTITKL